MNIYIGMFVIAFSTLALEVTFARLLSVITWYHLAFFAISTAMLGMTAGAVTVYLKPDWFTRERLAGTVSKACLGYSLVVPFVLVLLCLIPITLEFSIMSLFALLIATASCSLPFYFSGIAVTGVLTRHPLPVGKLYASDLIGASLGCLFVLAGLGYLDAPSLILLCAAVGGLAGISFAWDATAPKLLRRQAIVCAVLIAAAFVNSLTSYAVRPFIVKGKVENSGNYLLEEWNSFSRVAVYKPAVEPPQYWGPSPFAPMRMMFQYLMNIDGDANTVVRKFSSLDDIEHLRFDVTNVAYYLRPKGGACIIGVGGGRDIQSALLFGHEKVTGVEVNPIFVRLLKTYFRDFAGIAGLPGVNLVVDEARSYLSRTRDKYSLIQMSLVDTWAATGAGAFSLTENALYTVEAWRVFLQRLSEDGIFTVSRWHSQKNIGETGRVLSLAVSALLRDGVQDPSRHIAMVTTFRISTLLVSRQPFSLQDIERLKKVCGELRYSCEVIPGETPSSKVIAKIISARSENELESSISDEPLNYEPSTDENPYFFNMLRLNHLGAVSTADSGIITGNLIATLTLTGLILSLLILTIVTIAFPLFIKTRSDQKRPGGPKVLWSGALYFSLIGAGFMLIEIALMQRLSVFLGHPVYALGILLFSVIASTGLGSLLSERLPLGRTPWLFLYPVVTVLVILAVRFALPAVVSEMITSPMMSKIFASISIIAPLGLLMGMFFPTGMQLVRIVGDVETPWYWALNGIFGVLCSALAVFFSIYFGISSNFYIAALCYVFILPCIYHIYNARRNATPKAGSQTKELSAE